ncbi:MAG: DNA-binding domain-containing protein [Gammaproteobacteria bacterium]|nr:DNA-binding domain-containing protein [Gammaproteobacteria bacterium]
MKLEQLQSLFLEDIINRSSTPKNTSLFETDERLSPKQRIEIYSEGYQLRLIEALMDTYPSVHTLLGDEDFENIGRQYIAKHPSKHFSLRYFGSKLSEFITDHNSYKDAPFLSEMAEFEWKLRHAFDAADLSTLKREELAAVNSEAWPELRFKLHPSFSIINFDWNTPFLWKAIIQEAPPEAPKKQINSQHWIIWRPALETQFRSTDELEAMILKEVLQQHSFNEICELISLEAGEGAEHLAVNYLSRWVDEGLLLPLK